MPVPSLSLPKDPQTRAAALIVALVLVLILTAIVTRYPRFVGTRVVPPPPQEAVVGGLLETTPFAAGSHTLTFEARTRSGQTLTAATSFTVDTTTAQTYALQEVCVDPTDFEVSVRWAPPVTTNIQFRLAGETTWRHPCGTLGCTYQDSPTSRHALIFSGGNGTNNPLPYGTDFEFQLYPNAQFQRSAAPSEIFRFNSGPAPTPQERNRPPCAFRRLH